MIFNLGLKAMILLKICLLLLSIPVITKKIPRRCKKNTLTWFQSSSSVICLFSFDKRQSEGQRNVIRVHMSNGRHPTVLIAQDIEEPWSLGAKNMGRVDEKLVLCAVENRLGDVEH